MSTFGPDGHLSKETIDALTDEAVERIVEAVATANRRRDLAIATAPWWLRTWWRLTKGGPS